MTYQDLPKWLEDLGTEVLNAAFEVHRELGPIHSEIVYHRAMQLALADRRLRFESECDFDVEFLGKWVGGGRVDLVVEGVLPVELKALENMGRPAYDQILYYMRFLRLPLGFLLNFGKSRMKNGIHRRIMSSCLDEFILKHRE